MRQHLHFNPRPAWGATIAKAYIVDALRFQSTRPRGARLSSRLRSDAIRLYFNPRARVGRDGGDVHMVNGSYVFQSTRPRRARRRRRGRKTIFAHFNPRARVGRDTRRATRNFCGSYFNPRARVGRDSRSPHRPRQLWRFQSTRPRGARRSWPQVPGAAEAFQSTRPRRARRLRATDNQVPLNFNPRARVGRDVLQILQIR